MKTKRKISPIHPGQILKNEFMLPFKLSANRLALRLHVSTGRITNIVNGDRHITPDTALRLARFFCNTPQFWINLQSHYDFQIAEDTVQDLIERQVQPMSA
jgi:addiction module HigA family antidote